MPAFSIESAETGFDPVNHAGSGFYALRGGLTTVKGNDRKDGVSIGFSKFSGKLDEIHQTWAFPLPLVPGAGKELRQLFIFIEEPGGGGA